jgi:hypothetical protein
MNERSGQPKDTTPKEPLWLQEFSRLHPDLTDNRSESYDEWKYLVGESKPGFEKDYCIARAYTSHGGFYHFLKDIVGFSDMYKPLHKEQIIDRVFAPDVKRSMLMVNRGSFKSSVGTIGYSAWLVAREIALLHTSNIRILIGSESLALANAFVSSVNRTLRYNEDYIYLFGRHYPETSHGRKWKDNAFNSAFRTQHGLKEMTASSISIGSPRPGFHYDVVLADDLQAERRSSTLDQLDRCWDFYQLLHSLLEPTWPEGHPMWAVFPTGPTFRITGTRWHFDDIYQRIEERDKRRPDDQRAEIIYIPVIDKKTGEPTFPTRFTYEIIEELRLEHGPEHFASQYLLDPTPMETRPFRKDWLQTTPNDVIADPSKYGRMYIGSDWAFTERSHSRTAGRGRSRKADYTVHLAGVIDAENRIFVTHAYRDQVTQAKGIEALFKMYEAVGALGVGLQRYDSSHIEDMIKTIEREKRQYLNKDWISYPSKEKKSVRIKTVLQTVLERRKLFLPPNARWLEAEIVDYPNSLTWDGLDSLCNLVRTAKPPAKKKVEERKELDTPAARKVAQIRKNGEVLDVNGKKVKKKMQFW